MLKVGLIRMSKEATCIPACKIKKKRKKMSSGPWQCKLPGLLGKCTHPGTPTVHLEQVQVSGWVVQGVVLLRKDLRVGLMQKPLEVLRQTVQGSKLGHGQKRGKRTLGHRELVKRPGPKLQRQLNAKFGDDRINDESETSMATY